MPPTIFNASKAIDPANKPKATSIHMVDPLFMELSV